MWLSVDSGRTGEGGEDLLEYITQSDEGRGSHEKDEGVSTPVIFGHAVTGAALL